MTNKINYVYKIFPSATVDSRFYYPKPINSSHEYFLTESDSNDGFVHLSTATQVPGVLERYFADIDSVDILRIDVDRLSTWKRVTWDKATNDEEYPHLRAFLEGQDIDSYKEVEKGQGWNTALKEIADWLL